MFFSFSSCLTIAILILVASFMSFSNVFLSSFRIFSMLLSMKLKSGLLLITPCLIASARPFFICFVGSDFR